jgi:hypothetical protein
MSQPKHYSLLESFANIAIGFWVSVIVGEFAFPLLGLPITHTQNFLAVSIFTITSFLRSYLLRRVFNALHSNR